MPAAKENRAAVFSNQPQDVEVYRDGVWWPGLLLGWRHDAHGSCQVWVRIEAGGSESTIWTELESLRLPGAVHERPLGSVPNGAGGETERPVVGADPAATRELRRIDDGPRAGRSARRATEPAPIGAEVEPDAVPSWRLAAARAGGAATPGRHRAPAAGGRHRAADTETFPAVPDVESTVRQRVAWPVAVEDGWPVVVEEPRSAPSSRSWAPRTESDSDLFTRPLRLNPVSPGPVPLPRGAWDNRFGGV